MKMFVMLLAIAGLAAGCLNEEEKIDRKADKLHMNMLTVDTHCDTPMRLTRNGLDLGARNERGCVDFPRMKEGGLDAEFFAIFIGQGPRTAEAFEIEHQKTLATFDSIHHSVARYPEMAGLALNPQDASRLKSEGRIAAFIGIENGYPIGLDITKVKQYYDL
ncbi:MAG TPA: membrane dipeptidase, partial [Bacteroidales bacterium]|nr:membrane dipeptidase [Bacteroidales bacterium]